MFPPNKPRPQSTLSRLASSGSTRAASRAVVVGLVSARENELYGVDTARRDRGYVDEEDEDEFAPCYEDQPYDLDGPYGNDDDDDVSGPDADRLSSLGSEESG
ncbi:hypothetical protein JCM8547_000095 [Rhodosporidiobolus lusitaniae]